MTDNKMIAEGCKFKTKNEVGDLFHYFVWVDNETVWIRRRYLTKEMAPDKAGEFVLVKKFKDVYLYEQIIGIKYKSFNTILSILKHLGINFNGGE